jgi:hypothetical protein
MPKGQRNPGREALTSAAINPLSDGSGPMTVVIRGTKLSICSIEVAIIESERNRQRVKKQAATDH